MNQRIIVFSFLFFATLYPLVSIGSVLGTLASAIGCDSKSGPKSIDEAKMSAKTYVDTVVKEKLTNEKTASIETLVKSFEKAKEFKTLKTQNGQGVHLITFNDNTKLIVREYSDSSRLIQDAYGFKVLRDANVKVPKTMKIRGKESGKGGFLVMEYIEGKQITEGEVGAFVGSSTGQAALDFTKAASKESGTMFNRLFKKEAFDVPFSVKEAKDNPLALGNVFKKGNDYYIIDL